MTRVLGLIPARGGSKGVSRKNLADVDGRPLLAYTTEVARHSAHLDRVVVSTDDEEIAEVALAYGAEVPFMRPAAAASDQAPMLDVVRHALDQLRADGEAYDSVCLLQPTSPLRPSALVDTCIDRLSVSDATSVVTVRAVPHAYHPAWVLSLDASGYGRWPGGSTDPVTRRQDLAPAYHRDGLVYMVTAEVACGGSLYGPSLVPVPTTDLPACNVDGLADLEHLRRLVAPGGWDRIGRCSRWWEPEPVDPSPSCGPASRP